MTRAFKVMWFMCEGVSLVASAHHFQHIRSRKGLQAPCHELATQLLGTAPTRASTHVGAVRHPHTGSLIWLGLGEQAALIECNSDNILVFPPWLSGDYSQGLMPACLEHIAPHHDALTWILDIEHIVLSLSPTHS